MSGAVRLGGVSQKRASAPSVARTTKSGSSVFPCRTVARRRNSSGSFSGCLTSSTTSAPAASSRSATRLPMFDARGDEVERTFLDEAGAPVRTKDGYSRVATRYDAQGHVVERAYFGPDGQPTR